MEVKRTRFGLRALKAKVHLVGLSVVDRRSAAGKELFAWREQLIADLGGPANLSAQKRALVESASRSMLLLSHVDNYLLSQECLINKRDRCFVPALLQRQEIATGLTRVLQLLGLERVEKKVDLQTILANLEAERDATTPNAATETGSGEAIVAENDSEHPADAVEQDFSAETDQESH